MAFDGQDITKIALAFMLMSIPYLLTICILVYVYYRSPKSVKTEKYENIPPAPRAVPAKTMVKAKSCFSGPSHEIKPQPGKKIIPKTDNYIADSIDFFDAPGICQQSRLAARKKTADSGQGVFTRRQPLSAAQYIEFYNTPNPVGPW